MMYEFNDCTFSKRYAYQFLFLRGGRGCYLFFMANLTEIGIGSMAGLISSGPMMLLGLKLAGLMILLIELDLGTCSLMLFVLF